MFETLRQKILSLIVSHNGISVSEIQHSLNANPQSIYSAILVLRKTVKIFLKDKKYYIDKGLDFDKCENVLCLHNIVNKYGTFPEWNKTDCSMYEIDPCTESNPEGFKIQDCPALKTYRKFGW